MLLLMKNFFTLGNALHLCNSSVICQNKSVIHSFSKYYEVHCLLSGITHYLSKFAKQLHLTPQITFLCYLNNIKISKNDIASLFSSSNVNWIFLSKLFKTETNHLVVPNFTKQTVSSTYCFENVIYFVKSGRSELSSWIIKKFDLCSDLFIDKMCYWRCFWRQPCSENFVKLAEKYPWLSLLLRKLQYVESPLFLTKRSAKYNFLGLYTIINITKTKHLDCQMWFQ